ncbi:LacI family DNA-binding transcriptional regulator [Kitasatospora cineracea]|uniref:LacI family transcriptional regulator n=1 Tax=Kitasatospora cineracea TaxID=88074 RepID=A0A8G1URQ8_9ACTN|nr:LacI family DNA-binding transcriptional regulator [Kitasatospora cineracea]ROR46547.1 LacI family transcriptional regulator [Kitasatospora cineracea]
MATTNGDKAVPRPASTDVARLAGVSQKTVSRVMRGEPHVRPEVREKVLRAAQQLRYRPNAAARSLTSGRTGRIGVVALGAKLYGPTTLLVAAEAAARSLGYAAIVAHTDEEAGHALAGPLERLLEQGVDGIILPDDIDDGEPIAVDVDVPVLTMGRFHRIASPRRVESAERADRSGYVATRHLIELGHTEIRHVSGPDRWWAARDRADGWRSALVDADLPLSEPVGGSWSCEGGYEAGLRLAEDAAMTAVFVANDEMAIGVIRALHDRGRRVPDDVSVVGMDDIPAARFLNPALTTIVQDLDAMAAEGVALLVEEIVSPTPTGRRMHLREPILAVRESTAPPRRVAAHS